jgi:predicted RNA binding protein YcfA (HicA-like mRNA interferase family)
VSLRKITPIHYRTLVKVFESAGFAVKRQKGDHIIMSKPGIKRPIVIKTSPSQVPVTHIRTNLANAGLDRKQYFELLEQVK